jgi:hypothetical protein
MPSAIMVEVMKAKKRKLLWSGKSIGQMAVAIGTEGHSTLYAFLSLAAHGRITGNDVVHVARGAEHVERFEPRERPQDREALAFNARRTLHEVDAVVARDWLGYVPLLPTTKPVEGEAHP